MLFGTIGYIWIEKAYLHPLPSATAGRVLASNVSSKLRFRATQKARQVRSIPKITNDTVIIFKQILTPVQRRHPHNIHHSLRECDAFNRSTTLKA